MWTKIAKYLAYFFLSFLILTVVLVRHFGFSTHDAIIGETKLILSLIDQEIAKFVRTRGKLPLSLVELNLSIVDVDDRRSMDPWGEEIRFEIVEGGKGYVLFSSGPDKIPKTNDDIFLK